MLLYRQYLANTATSTFSAYYQDYLICSCLDISIKILVAKISLYTSLCRINLYTILCRKIKASHMMRVGSLSEYSVRSVRDIISNFVIVAKKVYM